MGLGPFTSHQLSVWESTLAGDIWVRTKCLHYHYPLIAWRSQRAKCPWDGRQGWNVLFGLNYSSGLRALSLPFIGFYCLLFYHIHGFRSPCWACLAVLSPMDTIRRLIFAPCCCLPGLVDLSVLKICLGVGTTSKPFKFINLTSWAELLLLLFCKFFFHGLFFDACLPRTPWVQEKFSAGLNWLSSFNKCPLYCMSALIFQFLDSSLPS